VIEAAEHFEVLEAVRFSSTAAYWAGQPDALAQLPGVAHDVEAGDPRGAAQG
jgi:hypothetical protein